MLFCGKEFAPQRHLFDKYNIVDYQGLPQRVIEKCKKLNERTKNESILSLCSTKIGCAELAAKFGGGGHKGAAGFSSNKFELEVTK